MHKTTWMLLGATSIIAKEFGHLAAASGCDLILVGRDAEQLAIMAADYQVRHRIHCEVMVIDFAKDPGRLIDRIKNEPNPLSLYIAQSVILENDQLDEAAIQNMVFTNIHSIAQLTHTYWNKTQDQHQLVFLSSVAACRGRSKNSLYGASKAAIEIYLEGLQQQNRRNTHITIARLGFIDTIQTFGAPGIFYAANPKQAAKACWQQVHAGTRLFYHPFFWRYIMAIISRMPFFIYKRMGKI